MEAKQPKGVQEDHLEYESKGHTMYDKCISFFNNKCTLLLIFHIMLLPCVCLTITYIESMFPKI